MVAPAPLEDVTAVFNLSAKSFADVAPSPGVLNEALELVISLPAPYTRAPLEFATRLATPVIAVATPAVEPPVVDSMLLKAPFTVAPKF